MERFCPQRRLFLLSSLTSSLVHIHRCLSAGEVSTALRPFFFSVHPDLFGRHPTERAINENSLKLLNSYIETQLQNRPTQPTTLTFYLRSQLGTQSDVKRGSFQSVRISLAQRDVRKTIVSILQSCNLPTSYVDSIPTPTPRVRPERPILRPRADSAQDFGTRRQQEAVRNVRESESFTRWVRKNVDDAHKKLDAVKPVREEIVRLHDSLCKLLGLNDVVWDCGWNVAHFRGCLQSFQALTSHHGELMGVLKGRTLVFGSETGVSLNGHVILNSGEVRHNWLDLLRNVHKHDAVLLRIPAVERAVSRVLQDIKVVHRKFQPKVMAEHYESQLRKLATSLGDYRGKQGYPKSWPQSFDQFQLVVETEAGPLMLSPTGQFIVPASCPSFLLVNFISENLKKAAHLLEQYESNKHKEEDIHEKCVKDLGLAALHKDDNITPDLMIGCCERLLAHKENLGDLLHGVSLFVTHYYSVLSDGEMCVPWNWKL